MQAVAGLYHSDGDRYLSCMQWQVSTIQTVTGPCHAGNGRSLPFRRRQVPVMQAVAGLYHSDGDRSLSCSQSQTSTIQTVTGSCHASVKQAVVGFYHAGTGR
jgi:hypothetical protein